MEERTKVIEFSAARLMRCRARYSVYSERADSTGNPALRNIAVLEEGILREAERDWQSMHRWLPLDLDALLTVLERAKEKAKQEVCVAGIDDKITTEALAKHLDDLEVYTLLQEGS